VIGDVLKRLQSGERVTQKDRVAAYRAAKESVELGEVVEGDAREYLMHLLHFYIPTLRSRPIDIRIEEETGWSGNTRKTIVLFEDGVEKLMSLRRAAEGKTQAEHRRSRNTFLHTFRREVKEQIFVFKKKMLSDFLPSCEITGTLITWDTSDVDHYQYSFLEAVTLFLKEEGLSFENIELVSDYEEGGHFFASRELAARWGCFHRDNCRLRIVSKKIHRKLTGMSKSKSSEEIDEWVDEKRKEVGLPPVGPPDDPTREDFRGEA
jgi:hypothetical protein